MARRKNTRKKPAPTKTNYTGNKRQRRAFYSQIKTFLASIGQSEIFDLFIANDLEVLYLRRVKPIRLEYDSKSVFTKSNKKLITDFVHEFFIDHKMTVIEGCPPIPTGQYFTIGVCLAMFIEQPETCISFSPNIMEIHKRLTPWIQKCLGGDYKNFEKLLWEASDYLRDHLNCIDGDFLTLGIKNDMPNDEGIKIYGRNHIYSTFTMVAFIEKRNTKHFYIDGKGREAFQLGIVERNSYVSYPFFGTKRFANKKEKTKEKTFIYVQKHALNRLSERLDCLERFHIHHLVQHNILYREPLENKDPNKNTYLIPFYAEEKKIGYLVAEYIECKGEEYNAYIVRTFLFLTYNGTPEGRKLKQLLGLSKMDIQWLKLDKLSCFVNSDLKNNKEIVSLLEQCGLGDLLTFEILNVRHGSLEGDRLKLVQRMTKYLSIELEEETVTEDDMAMSYDR